MSSQLECCALDEPMGEAKCKTKLGTSLYCRTPPDAGVVPPSSMKFCLRGDDL